MHVCYHYYQAMVLANRTSISPTGVVLRWAQDHLTHPSPAESSPQGTVSSMSPSGTSGGPSPASHYAYNLWGPYSPFSTARKAHSASISTPRQSYAAPSTSQQPVTNSHSSGEVSSPPAARYFFTAPSEQSKAPDAYWVDDREAQATRESEVSAQGRGGENVRGND